MKRAPQFRLKADQLRLTETAVAKACKDLLGIRGYKVVRLQSGLFKTPDGRWIRVGEPGMTDYFAAHKTHRPFFMEVKRPDGTTKPNQDKWIWELETFFGVTAVVIDSSKALGQWLAAHERSP